MFGLSFLNSFFLWGLAAASIPLIIHLIKRNRAVRLPFAAMRFLQLEPNERTRSQRLKQIILLLMRITAFALLALAFARPFFENVNASFLWGDQSNAAVILVDNSFSMAQDDNFQKAIAKARELLTSFEPGNQVTVLQFAESVASLGESRDNFAALTAELDARAALSMQSTNYLPALQTAETILLEAPAESKSIYLISDFQKSGWENLHQSWEVHPSIKMNLIPVGDGSEFSNIAVKDVRVSRESDLASEGDVLVRLKNYGNKKLQTQIRLLLNEREVSRKNESLSPTEEKIVHFKRTRFPDGFVTGIVEASSEAENITIDNQYFFVIEKKTKSQILAVNGEPNKRVSSDDELFFLDRAVNLPKLAKYSLVQTTPENLNDYDFSNYRAIILANVKDLGRATIQRLTYYVRGGGGLILTLGDRVNPVVFNRLFAELSPAPLTGQAFNRLSRDSGVILAEIDYQHPIFRIFSDPGQSDLSAAQFFQYFHTQPVNTESVLAYFDDGSPGILERRLGNGNVILFTSSLDTEWNNLPVKSLFLPLIYQTLDYVASEQKGQKSFLIGNPVAMQSYSVGLSDKSEASDPDLTIQLPSGKEVEVEDKIFEQTSEAGIYEIKEGGNKRPLAYFAVNVDSRESDLMPAPIADLNARFNQQPNTTIQTASISAREQINHDQEKQQKLWRFLVFVVLLLLVGETWLANRTYR